MKTTFVFLLLLLFIQPSFGQTACEQMLRQAVSKNWLARLKNIVLPDKINWNLVNKLLKEYRIGAPGSTEWLSSVADKIKNGKASYEEIFAYYTVVDPQRGLRALKYLQSENLIRARTKFWFPKSNNVTVADRSLFDPRKTFIFPGEIKDFENFWANLIKTFEPESSQVLNVVNHFGGPKTYTKIIAQNRESAVESVKVFKSFAGKPMTEENIQLLFDKALKPKVDAAIKIGLFEKSDAEIIADLGKKMGSFEKASHELQRVKTDLYTSGIYFKKMLGKELFNKALSAGFFYFLVTDEGVHQIANNIMTVSALLIDQQLGTHFYDKIESQFEREQRVKDRENKLPTDVTNKIDDTAALDDRILKSDGDDSFNPYDTRLLNPNPNPDLQNSNYPCDPYGMIYSKASKLSKAELAEQIKEFRSYIRPWAVGYNGNCLQKLRDQLKESDTKKQMEKN